MITNRDFWSHNSDTDDEASSSVSDTANMDDNSGDDDGTGDDVLADDDKNDDAGGDENDDGFKEFLRNNKDGIIYCMRKTRLPLTNNPFASFENTERFVRLMRHEGELQVMLEFMLQDEDLKRLQAE